MADKVLVLGFKTTPSQANTSFTVNRPASTLTAEHIKAAMQEMIDQNAYKANVVSVNGYKEYELIGSISYAKYVTTEDISYDF